MTDLNMMMREQARNSLQTQLDAAVTNGDTEAARKISDDIAKLAVSAAPKAPPFGDTEIRAELDKQTWFGTDPRRSAKAVEFGKTMDPRKFATAEAFAAAIVKAVDEEFKPASRTAPEEEGEEAEGEEDEEAEGEEEEQQPATGKRRRTDGPGENDTGGASRTRRASGPWTKLSDAPAEVQKEIKRQADKLIASNAKKEQRDDFIARALGVHYAQHQRNKGKK